MSSKAEDRPNVSVRVGTRGPLDQRVVLKAAASYHIPDTCAANDVIFLESRLGPPLASQGIESCHGVCIVHALRQDLNQTRAQGNQGE